MAKLMVGWARFLPLYTVIPILLAGIAIQPAHAKLGPISIRSVYTTDENQNNKTVFTPGEKINYHVDVDNTTNAPFPIDIRFQVFANSFDPTLYGYDQTYHVDQMPVGLSRFYAPTTLPSNAASYWYILRIFITPSGCSGTGCTNDGDWGENTFTIQVSRIPEGKAPNLIVLVHGCCTDANGLREEWDSLGGEITQKIQGSNTSEKWEIVVWDWTAHTPGFDFIRAYNDAPGEGRDRLAPAIWSHSYKYIHMIAHSAGSRLIQQAAKEVVNNYKNQENKPFIHLTFLDAFTPTPPLGDYQDSGENAYGFLEGNPHYSEQYVNRPTPQSPDFPFTDTCLNNAFNFNITDWKNNDKSQDPKTGHFWPVHWYKQSVTGSGFKYGFPLSFEGGVQTYTSLFMDYPNGFQCGLTDVNTKCKTGVLVLSDPAYRCW